MKLARAWRTREIIRRCSIRRHSPATLKALPGFSFGKTELPQRYALRYHQTQRLDTGYSMTTLEINLPDSLAREAERSDLLTSART